MFEVGTEVRVKKVEVGECVRNVQFSIDMLSFIGEKFKIKDGMFDKSDSAYNIFGYYFAEEWLEEVEKEKIFFSKVKPDAIIPSKRDEDAGWDVYACFEEENIVIMPHETKMIPTGIATAFSEDYVAILKERGSTGTKGMGQRAGVIDSGFRNEWMCPITNHNEKPLIITKETNETTLEILKEDYIVYPYKKAICQFIMVEVPKFEAKEIPYSELKEIKSERGMGMLGSSDK